MGARDFCTVTASTKRRPAAVSGKTGAPVANLSSLAITPLWPIGRETATTLAINRPAEGKECYHVPKAGDALPDIVEGDILTVDSVDYPVMFVGEWTDDDVPALTIVVEEVKGT